MPIYNNLWNLLTLRETTNICDNEMLNAILFAAISANARQHIHFHTDIRSGTVQYIYQHDLTSLFCNLRMQWNS